MGIQHRFRSTRPFSSLWHQVVEKTQLAVLGRKTHTNLPRSAKHQSQTGLRKSDASTRHLGVIFSLKVLEDQQMLARLSQISFLWVNSAEQEHTRLPSSHRKLNNQGKFFTFHRGRHWKSNSTPGVQRNLFLVNVCSSALRLRTIPGDHLFSA